MIRVLFVCLGNICRSPMAEAIFRKKIKDQGLTNKILVDSAGTGDWHIGKEPHRGTKTLLADKKIDATALVARQVTSSDWEQFDYMIAMDAQNMIDMENWKISEPKGVAFRLLDLIPDSEIKDVPDPYFTGNFEQVYELIDRSCDALLAHIRDRESL